MSGKHQWLKFWPQDWQNDTALATCSIGARGLWISMICVMHAAEPYGHMTVNGRPATTRHIASIARISDKDAAKLLDELEDAGVFSRTVDGTIYSRRMVRDDKHAEAGRNAVAKRWEGKVTPGSSSPPTTQAKSPPNSPPSSLESEAEAEAEAEKKEPPTPPASGGLACVDGFDTFWERYPRRDSKGHARTAWVRATRKASADEILAGLERYQFSETRRYQPLPATWLNGERWLSDTGDGVGDGFDPVLRAVGLRPEDFDEPEFPQGRLLQ